MTSASTGGKNISEINTDHQTWLDSQPMTSTCTLNGCGASWTGPAGEVRELAADHRRQHHPEVVGRRTRRKPNVSATRFGQDSDPDAIADAISARHEREQQQLLDRIDRHRRRQTQIRRLETREHPLGPAQLAILAWLDVEPLRISELAARRGVAMAAMGKTLTTLQRRGLVERVQRGLYARTAGGTVTAIADWRETSLQTPVVEATVEAA